MALTQGQYNALVSAGDSAQTLLSKSQELRVLFMNVINRGNPTNPFNDNETLAHLQSVYSASYTQLKADLLTAYNSLP